MILGVFRSCWHCALAVSESIVCNSWKHEVSDDAALAGPGMGRSQPANNIQRDSRTDLPDSTQSYP